MIGAMALIEEAFSERAHVHGGPNNCLLQESQDRAYYYYY